MNTSIVGSNGVLSRVAEDGVLPDWFLKPHPRYGTNYRLLYLIAGLQLFTIFASRGDVILLGEAYAFGVVWSFVFNTLSMVVLRFKKPRPARFRRAVQHPLSAMSTCRSAWAWCFLRCFSSALANLVTKPVATDQRPVLRRRVSHASSRSPNSIHRQRRGTEHHEHIEQFNREMVHEGHEGRAWASRSPIASWWRFARRTICSCSIKRWPTPIRKRPTSW